jgi:hypothetical protein
VINGAPELRSLCRAVLDQLGIGSSLAFAREPVAAILLPF